MSSPESRDALGGGGIEPVELQLRDGRRVLLRAARAGDGDRIQGALRAVSPESRYTRFMSALREATPAMLDRATHSDPVRQLQLLAVNGLDETVVGGARFDAARESKDCEFAIMVADNWQRTGLASALLQALMRAARERGFERMGGYILATNAPMLSLARKLGFERAETPEGPTVCLMRCQLATHS